MTSTGHYRWACVGAGVALLAGAAVALGTAGNRLTASATATVTHGHRFTVKVTGAEEGGGTPQVFLDRHQCAATYNKEFSQDGTYKSGKSYFLVTGERTSRETHTGFYVAPQNAPHTVVRVSKTLTGHAGSRAGAEHVCAFLVPGYGKDVRATATYMVH